MQNGQLLFPFQIAGDNDALIGRAAGMTSADNSSRGMLIIGPDGSGKTTILKELQKVGRVSGDWFFVRGDQDMTQAEESSFESFLAKESQGLQALIVDDADILAARKNSIELKIKDFYDKEIASAKTILLLSAKRDFAFKMKDLNSRMATLEREYLGKF